MGGAVSSVEGYRVVHRQPGSPLEEAGLEPYFDFIVQANGIRLTNDSTFSVIISKSVNCRVFLKVFNTRSKVLREAVVTPKEGWGGQGLLGGEIRYEEWSSDDEFGLRVVEVVAGSVAEQAGIVAGTDYIVGTEEVSVSSIEELAAQTMKKLTVSLDVYSALTLTVRRVTIRQNEENPTLGIDLGQGILHALTPAVDSQPVPVVSPPAPLPVNEPVPLPPPPKVTYLQSKPDQSAQPPPPPLAKHPEHDDIEPQMKVYLVLGPPSIYEKETGNSFVINVLNSPYIRAADGLSS